MKTSRYPSWNEWVQMPMLTATEAVALSLNVEPTLVSQRDLKTWTYPRGDRLVVSIPGFYGRLNLYTRCHIKPLSTIQLAAWTQSVGWNIPEKLASLAPVDAASTLSPAPDDLVTKALLEVVALGTSADDLRQEIERLGCRFVEIDDEQLIVIPNGMTQGEREPLSNAFSALGNLYASNPKAAKLGSMLRGTGASGSGARASASWPGMPIKAIEATMKAKEGAANPVSPVPPASLPPPKESVSAPRKTAILGWLQDAGYDPLQLPKFRYNAPGVKAAVKQAMIETKGLGFTDATFEKAWEGMRGKGALKDKEE